MKLNRASHKNGLATAFWLDRDGDVAPPFRGAVQREGVRILGNNCVVGDSTFLFDRPTPLGENAAGVWIPGKTHGHQIGHIATFGCQTDNGPDSYWQGDTVLCEAGATGITLESAFGFRSGNCVFDSKSTFKRIGRIINIESSCGFKTFVDQIIDEVWSVNPRNNGGNATPCHGFINSDRGPVTVEIGRLGLFGKALIHLEGAHPITLKVHNFDADFDGPFVGGAGVKRATILGMGG